MKQKISIILRVIIGCVFIFSAYTKFIAPGIIEIILIDHGIASTRELAAVIVRLLIGLEFAAGVLLLQPYFIKKLVLPFSITFMLGFTVYLFYSGFILGDNQNCGCFGSMIEMSPVESIIKNIFIILGLITIYKLSASDKKNILITVGSLIIPIAVVFLSLPIKSEKDFRFSEFTDFVGKGRTDLSEGEVLIAIYNTECDHCRDVAKSISELKNVGSMLI